MSMSEKIDDGRTSSSSSPSIHLIRLDLDCVFVFVVFERVESEKRFYQSTEVLARLFTMRRRFRRVAAMYGFPFMPLKVSSPSLRALRGSDDERRRVRLTRNEQCFLDVS